MCYPPPPRRPQAYRVRFARTRGDRSRGRTWRFCVAALALLAGAVAVTTSRSAVAAPVGREPADLNAWAVARGGHSSASAPARAETARLRAQSPLDEPEIAGALVIAPPARAQAAAAGPGRIAVAGRYGASYQGRQLRAQVTAYSASVEEGTAWGITRSGTRARPGVVAVDPSVIPLGSRVRIAGLPGVYRAEDTGGDIRGAHIDVFMESRAAALRFGHQAGVLVEVLD